MNTRLDEFPAAAVLQADVLVIGGGLAGCWAATTAAGEGARVVMADKGYVGTAGVTATAGPGHWWVPPDPALRAQAIAKRTDGGLGLADPDWMARVLDTTWTTLPTIARHYRFSRNEDGHIQYRGLRGPEYMRALRAAAEQAGVTVLDHRPAVTLLLHDDGSVAGAVLYDRRHQTLVTVQAGAVILACGGVAFRSRLLGSGNLTGDGLLMAAEAGASLSGMEFTGYCTVAPAGTNMTRSMSYAYARYFDAAGAELPMRPGPEATRDLAAGLLRGAVYCTLADTPPDIQAMLPRISPNVQLVFDRLGIDPYRNRFQAELHAEGTVRGTGGVVVTGDDCSTAVPGLFVAGDTATRENIAGATSGGGAQNSAWALSSGVWAGRAAAGRGRSSGRRAGPAVRPAGTAGLSAPDTHAAHSDAVDHIIKDEMLHHGRNLFRTGEELTRGLGVLDAAWARLAHGVEADVLRARESAALLASARWSWRAASARRESRGLHQRADLPHTDAAFGHRLVLRGVDEPHLVTVPAAAEPEPVA